jgi:membrane protease YdiL (CAAX protease family)
MKRGTQSRPQPSTWLDLAAYLVVGMGLFFFATYLVGRAMLSLADEWIILHSVTIDLLNAVCLGGTVYILGVHRGKITWSGIGLKPMRWRWRWLLAGIPLMAITIPIRGLLATWASQTFVWETDAQGLTRTSLMVGGSYTFSWINFGLTLLCLGILVPMAEELYFRGLIHDWLQSRFGFGLRILLSSLVFGLWHLPAVGAATSNLILGLILTVAYEKSRSIWLPIALHLINNISAVFMVYLALAVFPK